MIPKLIVKSVACRKEQNCIRVKPMFYGREPWSSGYGRRLTFQRLWVRIPALYTGWTLFTVKDENKWKRLLTSHQKWKNWKHVFAIFTWIEKEREKKKLEWKLVLKLPLNRTLQHTREMAVMEWWDEKQAFKVGRKGGGVSLTSLRHAHSVTRCLDCFSIFDRWQQWKIVQ